MPIQAQNPPKQFMAEAIHHAHHNDQRRDPKRNADQGENRNHRDKAFPLPRTQIAEGDHTLKSVEHAGSAALDAGDGVFE